MPDWLKVEKSTPRKPEVLRLAMELNIHPDHAFGICFRFWSWCDDNLKDGNAIGVTDVMLNALLERDGIATALINVGWLRVRNGSLEVPNYDRHLSENAKKRGLSQQRTAKSRSRSCNGASVTNALPEKRREEKRIKDIESEAKVPDWLFATWEKWKLHLMQRGAPTTSMQEEQVIYKLVSGRSKEDAVKDIEESIRWNCVNVRNHEELNRSGGSRGSSQKTIRSVPKAEGAPF